MRRRWRLRQRAGFVGVLAVGDDGQSVGHAERSVSAGPTADRRHDQGRSGHSDQRRTGGEDERADRRQSEQRCRRRTPRALDARPHLQDRGEAGATVPVLGRRAGQGRHRAAPPGQDDRHRPSSAVTDGSVAVLAHGLGGSSDLPIPYTYALIGAAWALTFTFAVVAFAWRRPRFDPEKPGRELPQWVTRFVDSPVTRWALAAAGVLFAAWVAMAAFFGGTDGNPVPG